MQSRSSGERLLKMRFVSIGGSRKVTSMISRKRPLSVGSHPDANHKTVTLSTAFCMQHIAALPCDALPSRPHLKLVARRKLLVREVLVQLTQQRVLAVAIALPALESQQSDRQLKTFHVRALDASRRIFCIGLAASFTRPSCMFTIMSVSRRVLARNCAAERVDLPASGRGEPVDRPIRSKAIAL
jgi:hypothetical protein